jgi:GNAT superfamily N-acetyltransferase
MTLTMQPAVEFPLQVLCDTINSAFKGYLAGEVTFTPPIFANFITQGDIHLGRSLIAISDSQPVGISLHARHGATTRIGLFGTVQGEQGKGVGKWLLGEVMREARERGDQYMVLECFEQNTRAVKLYEWAGFRTVRRLMGYTGENLTGEAATLQPVDIVEAARRVIAWQSPDLPWQCGGEYLMKFGPPAVAYKMDDAYAIISNPAGERVAIFGLAVPPAEQRQGKATRLVSALIAAHPGKQWAVSQICPEEYGSIFTRSGFKVMELNQLQMEVRL